MSRSNVADSSGTLAARIEEFALAVVEARQDVLGEVVEQDCVGGEEVLDQRAAIQRGTPARDLHGEVHGERPPAGGVNYIEHCGLSRWVEPEVGDVLRGDCEVSRADPGDLTGGPQPGDTQVRLDAASEDEVQLGWEGEDQRLEKHHQRVVAGDVDVIEDDQRVALDG